MDSDHAEPSSRGDEHSLNSTLREKIAEHIFIGDLLRRLWQRGIYNAEILRSEFDAGGYDLVLSWGKIVRHIQFKTSIVGGKTSRVNISLRLAEKPSGCVVWMLLDDDLSITSYRWYGGENATDPLPDIKDLKIAKHPKGDSMGKKTDRPNLRIVEKRHFKSVNSMDDLIRKLLGEIFLLEKAN